MNRRDFFRGAAAFAAAAPFAKGALAHESKPKAGNNPIWLMTSAFASDPDFETVAERAKSVGAQGLELCVFRRDTKGGVRSPRPIATAIFRAVLRRAS